MSSRSVWINALRGGWLVLVAASISAPSPTATSAMQQIDEPSKELIALTNLSRTSNALPALPADQRLNTIALSRSEDMIARRYFSHVIPPDDRTVVDIIESLGLRFRSGSENIAWNDALDFVSVRTASDDFMNSLSHRTNVLDGRWHRLGAGAVSGDGRKMYTVVFLELPAEPSASTLGGEPRDGSSRTTAGQRVRAAGDLVPTRSAPTGLMDSLVNRSVRLFLSL